MTTPEGRRIRLKSCVTAIVPYACPETDHIAITTGAGVPPERKKMILAAASQAVPLWTFLATVIVMFLFIIISARLFGIPGLFVSIVVSVVIAVILSVHYGT